MKKVVMFTITWHRITSIEKWVYIGTATVIVLQVEFKMKDLIQQTMW